MVKLAINLEKEYIPYLDRSSSNILYILFSGNIKVLNSSSDNNYLRDNCFSWQWSIINETILQTNSF